MPAYSAHDVFRIEEQSQLCNIFPTAHGGQSRDSLLGRIRSCEKILTFKSFHADMVLLEACYDPLRKLWPRSEGSLRQACRSSFQKDGDEFEACYVDIWLHSIRNHPSFFSFKDIGLRNIGNKGASVLSPNREAAVTELATFAASCGFRSEMIEVMRTDGNYHEYNDDAEGSVLSGSDQEVRLQDRCGRPSKADFDNSWRKLCSKSVLAGWDGPAKRHATTFAVARSFVRCLFKFERSYQVQKSDAHGQNKSEPSLISLSGSKFGSLYSLQRTAATSMHPPSANNRSGGSSTLLASSLHPLLPECSGSINMTSQVNEPDTMQHNRFETNAARQMSIPSSKLFQTTSVPRDRARAHDNGGELSAEGGRKRPPIHKKTMATIGSSRVTKSRQRASEAEQTKGRELRTLRLVEMHCPQRTAIERGSK